MNNGSVKLKDIVKYQEGPGIGAIDFNESGIPLIRISGMKSNDVSLRGCNYLSEDKVRNKWSHFILNEGDLLISASATSGLASVVGKEASGSIAYTGLIRFYQSKRINLNYLKYFMLSSSFSTQIDVQKTGSTIEHFGPTHLDKILIKDIDVKKQTEIAEELDRTMRSIDHSLKTLKNKLLLLEEYKTSIIHNAVTKGLDANGCRILDGTPASEMKWKDSGVEWIGEIPEGWGVVKFKSAASVSMGETILKDDLVDDGVIPVRSATKTDKYFGYVNSCSKKLKVGDIVVGARGTIGKPSVVTEASTSTQTTLQLSLNGKINSKYCFYWLMGNHDEIFSYDQTAIPQYTVDDMSNVFIATQKGVESNAIAEYLDTISEIILLSEKAINKKIALLIEYKKSLINEAVSPPDTDILSAA